MRLASVPSPLRPSLAAFLLVTLLGTACSRSGHPEQEAVASGPVAPGLPEDFEGQWQGLLPCTDCEALDVRLVLERQPGAPARYRLTERYLGGPGDDGVFASEGGWDDSACTFDGLAGRCIDLHEAGQRWFRHEDGSLQAITADGRALDPDGARLQRQ